MFNKSKVNIRVKKTSKRMSVINNALKENNNFQNLENMIDFLKSSSKVKFNESIDLSIELGIKAKRSDENVRGGFVLPYGSQKKIKVAALVPSSLEEEAKKAGADIIGLDDIIAEIKSSETVNFDICFASSDVFSKITPIAKILGKNKVMPNSKDGTVTSDIGRAIREVKEGRKIVFKNDSAGYLRFSVGKISMSTEHLVENIKSVVSYIFTIKPTKVKEMIRCIYVNSTMGTGLRVPMKFIND